MAALEPLCHLFGVNPNKFSKYENILIETDIFIRIFEKLKEFYRQQHSIHSFISLKLNGDMINMMDSNIAKHIINDITSTNEYTIQGISNYTSIHVDILTDLAAGLNTNPLLTNFRRIVELHREVRPKLYHTIAKKIIAEFELICEDVDSSI